MHNCLASISVMILFSPSTFILLLLHVIRDFVGAACKAGPWYICPRQCFKAIVLNKILCALLVYFGCLTEGHKDMLKRVLKRAYRMGFTFQFHDLDDLNEIAQYNLFRSSRSEQHCLNHLYTVKSKSLGAMLLRTRGHDFVLPTIKYEFNKRHLIVSSLF